MADRRPNNRDEPEPDNRRRRRGEQEPAFQADVQQQQQQQQQRELPIPVPSGADLSYADLLLSEAMDPVHEVFNPNLIPAVWEPQHAILWDHNGQALEDPNDPGGPPPIALVAASMNPGQAYAFLPTREPIELNHAPGWGQVRFAVVYPHHDSDPPNVFRAPDPHLGEPNYVAIKILNKAVVDRELSRGGRENPYKEICRYQELGDNVHVIRCEAMEDSERLYIITPRCRSFVDVVFGRQQTGLAPVTVHAYVLQLLRILVYLQQHDIHHRDLSPDNLFLLPNGQLVLVDFAMSLRIPRNTKTGRRALIRDQGNFGTPAWMAPEILLRLPFDGVGADLWCVTHIIYNLMVNDILFHRAWHADWSYRFFVLAGGLTNEGMNEQAIEVLQEIQQRGDARVQNDIVNRAQWHLAFPPVVRTLFRHLLQNAPHERWTLGQVLRSDYVVNGPE